MQKVICPICEKQFKELNNSHLRVHNLDCQQFDKLYPSHPRMTTEQRKQKQRYQKLSPEMSAKLKKSHTLKGYIEKYGAEEGQRKWDEMKENKSNSKTLKRYVELYGEEEGNIRYVNLNKMHKTKMTKANFIKKYGIEAGQQKFQEFNQRNKESNTKEWYIKKYGTLEGTRKWNTKCLKNSRSSMKLEIEDYPDFYLYKLAVDRVTRQSIKEHHIPKIELISKGKYSIDHKFSVLEGFKQNIPPYIIGSKHNLEVVTHKQNSKKQDKCSITADTLFETYFAREIE